MILTNGRIYTLDAARHASSTRSSCATAVSHSSAAGATSTPRSASRADRPRRAGRAARARRRPRASDVPGARRGSRSTSAGSRRRRTSPRAWRARGRRRRRPVSGSAGAAGTRTAGRSARFPTRASLDRAAPDHPVALVRIDGHATWANSAALAAAGIDRATRPTRRAASSSRTPRGEPTGLLIDTAQRLRPARRAAAVGRRSSTAVRRAAIAECLAAGLTGMHEMGVDLVRAGRRTDAWSSAGSFPFRNYVAVAARSEATWDALPRARPREHRRRPGGRAARSSSWPTARSARAAPRCTRRTATIRTTAGSC